MYSSHSPPFLCSYIQSIPPCNPPTPYSHPATPPPPPPTLHSLSPCLPLPPSLALALPCPDLVRFALTSVTILQLEVSGDRRPRAPLTPHVCSARLIATASSSVAVGKGRTPPPPATHPSFHFLSLPHPPVGLPLMSLNQGCIEYCLKLPPPPSSSPLETLDALLCSHRKLPFGCHQNCREVSALA